LFHVNTTKRPDFYFEHFKTDLGIDIKKGILMKKEKGKFVQNIRGNNQYKEMIFVRVNPYFYSFLSVPLRESRLIKTSIRISNLIVFE